MIFGGATKDKHLMQFQSNITAMPIFIAETEEVSGFIKELIQDLS